MRFVKWLLIIQLMIACQGGVASDETPLLDRPSRSSSPANVTPPKVRDSHKLLRTFLRFKNVGHLEDFNNLVGTFSEEEKKSLRIELVRDVSKEVETYILKYKSCWTDQGFMVNQALYRNIILYCAIIKPKCSTNWVGINNFTEICRLYLKCYPEDIQIRDAVDIIKLTYNRHLALKMNQDDNSPVIKKQAYKFLNKEGILFIAVAILVSYMIYSI